VIKMIMAMQHAQLPQTLYADRPNPLLDWPGDAVQLLREARAFPERGRPRRAAVSAFGINGTNAHVILEQPPTAAALQPAAAGEARLLPFVVSARSPAALRAQAARLHAHLRANPELGLLDVAHSLVSGRSAFEQRAVIVAGERAALLEALASVAAEESHAAVRSGRAGRSGRLGFVFAGGDPSWLALARNGKPYGTLRVLTFPDGQKLDGVAARVSGGGPGAPPPAAPAPAPAPKAP
jgi:acyl transferase domain-containing protein